MSGVDVSDFYRAFEERFLGSRELIRARRAQYLPFVQPVAEQYPGAIAFDVGCGRGEWLELMREQSLTPLGMDLDEGMLAGARAVGLNVAQGDAITHLGTMPSQSVLVLSAFHVAEHLQFEQLQELLRQAKRVLLPGGLLIIETPNPENLLVGSGAFYIDPTHVRPLPWQLLDFLVEHAGFARRCLLRLQEDPNLTHPTHMVSLRNVIEGVSPDCSVVAQAPGSASMHALLDAQFQKSWGLGLMPLVERFDARIRTLEEQSARVRTIEYGIEQKIQSAAELRAELKTEIKAELEAAREAGLAVVLQSRSWRWTAPLRAVSAAIARVANLLRGAK